MTELNSVQKRATEYNNGPLLLVAGPGSGKTRVIIERIIHLVNSGVKPDEILCLTFTKKATEEMSQRLENHEISDVNVSTFHSFAKSILEDNVLESGVNISSGVIKRSAQLAWGLKNIDSFDFQNLDKQRTSHCIECMDKLVCYSSLASNSGVLSGNSLVVRSFKPYASANSSRLISLFSKNLEMYFSHCWTLFG